MCPEICFVSGCSRRHFQKSYKSPSEIRGSKMWLHRTTYHKSDPSLVASDTARATTKWILPSISKFLHKTTAFSDTSFKKTFCLMNIRPQDLLSHEPTLWFRRHQLFWFRRTIFLRPQSPTKSLESAVWSRSTSWLYISCDIHVWWACPFSF